MSQPKDVVSVDEYSHDGTGFVEVKVRDGWIYGFSRADANAPYTFKFRQSPAGNRGGQRDRTPEQVRAYMTENYDAANLNPDLRDE